MSVETGGAEEQLRAEADGLRAAPAFEQAVAVYLAELVRWRETSPLMHKLSAHKGRMHVTGYLLHLSAVDQVAGGDGGVSYGALFELCVGKKGEVGARVLKTTLALLRLAGFVQTWRGAADGRVVFYRPTARMYDHAKLAYGYAAAALDVLEPEAERRRNLDAGGAFLQRMLMSAGKAHAEAPPNDLMPDFIGFIGEREGAGAVLAALMQSPEGEVPSRAGLASRFGLSKSQVTKILEEGAARGYFRMDAAGLPTVTDSAREAFRRWISIELAFHARHMR